MISYIGPIDNSPGRMIALSIAVMGLIYLQRMRTRSSRAPKGDHAFIRAIKRLSARRRT